MIETCPKSACPTILSSACVFYEGKSLLYLGISTNDSLEIALQKLDETIENLENNGGVTNTVTNYRSSCEEDLKVYAGYILNNEIKITRIKNGLLEVAVNLTDLEVDWNNKLNLTYVLF